MAMMDGREQPTISLKLQLTLIGNRASNQHTQMEHGLIYNGGWGDQPTVSIERSILVRQAIADGPRNH